MTDPWTPDPRTLEWAAERVAACDLFDAYSRRDVNEWLGRLMQDARMGRIAQEATR